jgi:hypothetical protein
MTATRSLRSKRFSKIAAGLGAAVVLGFAAACSSDSVSSPKAAAPLGMTAKQITLSALATLSGNILTPTVALERNTALTVSVSHSATIGSNGGTIVLENLGLKVTVPQGAIVGNPITITVTAAPGKVVAYEFEPHGTVFAKALAFEQDLTNTSWANVKSTGALSGGYFQALDQLNLQNGLSLLNEVLPAAVNNGKVKFNVYHFSGYMVSTGRAQQDVF